MVRRSDGRRAVVEVDLHLHWTDDLDPVDLLRLHDGGLAYREMAHGGRIGEVKSKLARENADDAPCAGLRAMISAKACRQGILVEHRRGAVGRVGHCHSLHQTYA